MRKTVGIIICTLLCMAVVCAGIAHAGTKKGLLVYDSVYGSTSETAYWIKAIIGHQEQLDVKSLPQVITVKPYDYVIIGSLTRWEKPSEKIYKFVEMNRAELAKKQVCYYLNCGDSDETMVLKAPGQKAHLIAGRNYLLDIMNKFPEIKPVVIGGFGGRQTFPSLGTKDRFWTWLVGKLAKEGAAWEGLDIWESLVPARVEAFANEVRVKVLGLPPCENVQQFRGYWESLQPASLTDASKKKYEPRPYTTKHSTERIYYTRSRIKGELNQAVTLLQQWAKENSFDLREQVKTYYNVYYQAAKVYAGTEIILHIVPSTMPEDPGTVHISFRCYDKPDKRNGAEADITKAEQLLWADGRKVE